jgi:hypothetical protein
MITHIKKIVLSFASVFFIFFAGMSIFSSLIYFKEVWAKESSNNLFYIVLDLVYVCSEIVILLNFYDAIFTPKENKYKPSPPKPIYKETVLMKPVK